MADKDYSSAFVTNSPEESSTSSSESTTSSPQISGGSGPSNSPYASAFSSSTSGSNSPYSAAFVSPTSSLSPENGQTAPSAPTQHLYQDSSQPWYKRAWDWANTPLTESLFGLPEDRPGAGGFERGVEHIVSGLTSPLSVALGLATFGTGSIIDSAGLTALKESGEFTAEQIADITKASQTALDAYKAQKPLEPVLREALAAGGHDPALLLKANKVFGDINKMSELAEPEVQRNLAMVGLKGEGQRAAFLENRLSGVLPENATEEQIAEHAAAEAKARETIATANGGFSNAELQELARTGETLSAAKTGFHPVEDAVREAGIDPALWKKGQDVLYKSGLTEHDLLQGNMVERGAFQILRKTVPELPIAATVRASKTANSLLNAGFTYQQLESAAAMSPRFLDALKEGDYDKAAEYGTEAFASGALGVLGASHALHSAGELFKPLLETNKFRPNDEWLFAQKALNEVQTQHAIGEQRAIDLDRAVRDILGHTQPGALQQIFGESPEAKAQKNLDLASVFHQVVTGGDRVKAAQWYNALSEALGRDERLPIPAGEPLVPASIPRGETHVIPDGSNEAGEVRVGPDGRPVVWLSPNGWSEFASSTGTVGSGISYSFPEAEQAAAKLHPDSPVKELFDKAREASHLAAVARQPGLDPNFTVRVASEELHHTWQRELSQSGDIRTHLDQPQWNRLNGIIPAEQTSYLNNLEYDKDPVTRVAETAAKFRAGLIPEGVSDEDAARWLNEYYKEVEAKHGPQSLDEANRINDIARQHVEDIYAAREAASRSTDQEAGNRVLGGVQEGSGRPAGVGQEEPPKGLSARELTPDESKEFDKLSKLKLRVGMGDPGSAGLVTGDNEVFIGRDHAELIREAGYKASPKEDLYAKFFKDGGVRIRTAGGTVHVDFMEPNADTWDRVYRSIASVPDANRYLVEYRPLKGGPGGFHTDAYDKDNLVFKLQDLQEGRTKEAPVGSVSYFRGGLASRERTWNYVKKFLPDEASKHDTQEKRDMLVSAFNMMPDQADYRAAAQAGRAGQMWYERSSRAFDALLDSGADFIKPKDKTKFLNFVAALSPVQPVKQNLLMALNLWAKWDKAGRPTDVDWSSGAIKNSSLYRILKGRGNTQGVDLPARMNNSIRALQGEPLSGPKVSAFTTNLGENANRVTNDTWMAVFGDQDPNRINKPAIYDAMTAKVREAAKAEGIAPRQAQAAIWSFIKSLAELSGWGNDRWIPPQEIIKQGLLTPELVATHSSDFADLLQNDPEIRAAFKNIGGDLNALDTKLKSYVPAKPIEGQAAEPSAELHAAAGRLEATRSNARIANHLARKTEPGLFDNTEFSPNNGLFSRERENNAPTWYLKSNQLIDSRMQGPMPADTVLKMLENNGVKPDELKYTGLSDFLREKGKAPVRPEELREYLAANNLQVQEVEKGDIDSKRIRESRERDVQELSRINQIYNEGGYTEEEARRLLRVIADGMEKSVPPPTSKFGNYVLPGGQNYREMLLTLPTEESSAEGKVIGRHWSVIKNVPEDALPSMIQGISNQTGLNSSKMLEIAKKARSGGLKAPDEFRSSHWDEPNVVGHVRFNDRTGPNGEKLLHLEELQSDWHQKGRTQGYIPQQEPRWSVQDKEDGTIIESYATEAEARARAAQEPGTQVIPDRTLAKSKGVPDAPFKKTWPELLMKRMIRYASEHGYDGVSWTPGEEQAARYHLSHQVQALQAFDNGDGTYNVDAKTHDGRVVEVGSNISAEKLPDHVGKDVAQKIINQNGKPARNDNRWREYSGVDLKVGGEGMKGFYDKIVPEAANKLGKQFGAKVGETKISAPEQGDIAHRRFSVRNPDGDIAMQYPTRQEAEAHAERRKSQDVGRWLRGSNWTVKDDYPSSDRKVPYFPITDSMRESVLKQGQPLFSRERPKNGLPDNLDEMIRSNVFKNQPKEYQDLVMNSLRRVAEGSLSEKELAASKFVRDEQDRNFQIGSSNDILHHYIEDYMTRVYQDTNPQGKVITSDAKGGKFATNVSMAKQRVYDSNLTALLKSPKKMELDPAKITARGRAMLIKAAANKQLIDTLRDNFTRASDGRPAIVLSGSGQVVSGANGEDPKTFIDPNRVRKINIAPGVVDQLSKSGDLQRFLDEGTIKDITPYVRPNNIEAAISRMEDQGPRQNAQYDEVGNNKLRTDLMYLKSMLANKDFSGLKDFNDKLERQYAWDPQDYITLDKQAMKGWNFITNDSSGHSVFVRSDILAHPEFAQYLKDRLGLEPSDIAKHPIGKALLGAGTRLKQTLLSLSPFHTVQIALRGLMTGVNPFTLNGPDIIDGAKVDPSDPFSPTKIRMMVEQGMTTGTDYKAMQEHSEGLSSGDHGLIRKIPGVGPILANSLNFYNDFLFKRFIPAVKATAAEHLFDEYRNAHPEWSLDRVAKAAALHSNENFGGINWKAMGRSATTQDWGRLMLLAPDWLEGELRAGARLFNKDEGGIGRRQIAIMTMSLWGIARVLNLMNTGNAHYEAPFGLATRTKEGKEIVYGIRTLPTDLLHAATSPVEFLKGRLSPTIHTGQELLTGRDNYGRKLAPEDLWADATRNLFPIPVQSINQAVSSTGPQVGNVGQVVKALGGTAQTYATPAQQLAADLAANHTESGPIDPQQMARHRTIMDFEDKVRAGEMSLPDVYKMYAAGQLHTDDLKKLTENIKRTKELSAPLASLYTRASRLPGPEYLQLYDQMNPSERTALLPLTLQVRKRYIAKAMKDLRPEERLKDPTFLRFLNMVTDQSPF